jgi:hypothetical protein
VAPSILTAIHHMLRDSTVYNDLGADHYHRLAELQAHHLVKQIAKLGFSRTIALYRNGCSFDSDSL